MLQLAEAYPDFVSVIPNRVAYDGNSSIHAFFEHCVAADAVYVRFDDDICYIEPGAIDRLVQFRLDNRRYFLVTANIVNNAITSHLHQRAGALGTQHGRCEYDCTGRIGWASADFAEHVHRRFLAALSTGVSLDRFKFARWELHEYERFSINCFAFYGADFAEFSGKVGADEECWLSVDKPRQLQRINCICGQALVSHFAFHTQRDHLEQSGLLEGYERIAGLRGA